MPEKQFILPASEYTDCKDAGINNTNIPVELTSKYKDNPEALRALEEARSAGKKAVTKSRISRGRYAQKMRKRNRK